RLSPVALGPRPSLIFLIFFLVIRRPPSSTPFPYTTLFRSVRTAANLPARRRGSIRAPPTTHRADQDQASGSHPDRRGARSSMAADRKSTRLNSSHVKISYAVFCLKKKKKKTEQTTAHTQTR